MKTATITSLHLRKSNNRSPSQLAFLLIPLVFVCFARFDHAKAQVSYRVPTSDPVLNMFQAITESQANSRAQMGLSRSSGSSNPPPESYQHMFERFKAKGQVSEYQAPLEMLQFPITATDFKSTRGRLLPVKIANSTPGLTPELRAAAIAQNNHFLDNFERLGRKNNVASSYAYLACFSLGVVTDQLVSKPDVQLLISAFNYSVANNPQFVTMAPRDKQFLYESNIITAGWIDYYATYGTKQEQQQAREYAWAVLNQLPEIDRR
jgi:hypothetical protein